VWVKGHASNEGNNRCDEIAVAASRSGHLLIDEGYEQAKRSEAALI
jgi:ribonuclease HI